jgi:hypothetical protein
MRYAYILILLLCVGAVSADGCFLPPETYFNDLYEPQQKAAIMHENGRETLILQVSYDGEPTDFGWIIPTPSPATVTEAGSDIFASLHYLTKAKYRSAELGRALTFGSKSAAMMDGVDVLNQQQIGVFEVTTLKATDAAALDSWLAQNGYRLPEGATEVLNYYVAKNWTYTALRMNIADAQKYFIEEIGLTALRLDFATPEPVYPLYISSMNAGETEVLLYIISQHKTLVEQEGFTLEYAGRVPESYLEEDEYYDNNQDFQELLREGEGRYITKHRAKMNASAMESDLTFLQAPNDKEERITTYAEGFWLTRTIQALIPLLIYGLLFWLLNKVRARRNQERTDRPAVNLGKHALLTALMLFIGIMCLLTSIPITYIIAIVPMIFIDNTWFNLIWASIIAAAALFFDFLLIRLIYAGIIGTRGKARKEVKQWAR